MSERAMVSRRFMPPDSGSTLSRGPLGELGELEQLGGARRVTSLRDSPK